MSFSLGAFQDIIGARGSPEAFNSSTNGISKGVTVEYRVRLLKDYYNQLYRSESMSNTQHQIPEGKIKSEDLSDLYVRVECQGLDKDDSDHPVALELRSETIKPLKEALGK